MADDPTPREPDALSLHTIADQADAYAIQEQIDADFAHALALEDEETSHGNFAPYRDNPDADDEADVAFEPYRDEPDAPNEQEMAPEPGSEAPRARWFEACIGWTSRLWKRYLRIGKVWKGIAGLLVVILIIAGVVAAVVLAAVPGKESTKSTWERSLSQDYDIRMTKLYPPLHKGASKECKQEWDRKGAILKCHRMILSSVWDDGDAANIEKEHVNPYAYNDEICRPTCRNSIRTMNACYSRADRFDLSGYGEEKDAFFTKDQIEEGPVAVYKALTRRYDRFCARAVKDYESDESEWETCAADLWMRWGIIDGTQEGHMNGLAEFLQATKDIKTVEAHTESGELERQDGSKKSYKVEVPKRSFGPVRTGGWYNTTDCGYCTVSWLERKFKSYEYGLMLDHGKVIRTMMAEQHPDEWDPVVDEGSGDALTLDEFSEIRRLTLRRCKEWKASQAIMSTNRMWEGFGWWCHDSLSPAGGPCQTQPNITTVVRQVIHGMEPEDSPLPQMRRSLESENTNAPIKDAYKILHDGISKLPCSLWFEQEDAISHVIPNAYTVQHLCSDKCRNAIDRIQAKGEKIFLAASKDPFVQGWNRGTDLVEKICLAYYPNSHIDETSVMCAPGYAAVGHPEWIFEPERISKPLILSGFSKAIDKLDKSLPMYPRLPKGEDDRIIIRRRAIEGVCNTCAATLLIGRGNDVQKRVDEFITSGEVDAKEYVRVAKKYFLTCAKLSGTSLSERQKKEIWQRTGLDKFD